MLKCLPVVADLDHKVLGELVLHVQVVMLDVGRHISWILPKKVLRPRSEDGITRIDRSYDGERRLTYKRVGGAIRCAVVIGITKGLEKVLDDLRIRGVIEDPICGADRSATIAKGIPSYTDPRSKILGGRRDDTTRDTFVSRIN